MSARNTIRRWVKGLLSNEALDLPSGGILTIKPKTNDQGKIRFGDGTTNMDLEIHHSATSNTIFDVGANTVTLSGLTLNTAGAVNFSGTTTLSGTNAFSGAMTLSAATGLTAKLTPSGAGYSAFKVTALTTNTVLSATHFGGIITNRGAGGAVTHTIPDATAALSGAWFLHVGHANQDVTFAINTVDTLVVINDVAADSVAWSTANEKIAGMGLFVCDGTSWFVSTLTGTMTIAT